MASELNDKRLRRLILEGRALVSELDLDSLLDRLLETAREVTGARYAALGILDSDRRELERFLTRGIDPDTERVIGARPRGRGILGRLIEDPRPLRLADVGDHATSFGFPAGHPPMRSFLGVPITVRGDAWGNLYLTEKAGGEFTADDEEAALILADWAAIAISNSRLLDAAESRRVDLERAVRGLEASQTIAVALGAETELSTVLKLIAERGRAIVDARSVVILLQDGEDLMIAAGAGHTDPNPGVRIPIVGSTSGEVMTNNRSQRIADVRKHLRVPPEELGVRDAHSALLVPLMYRGQALGVLAAFDRTGVTEGFGDDDEQVLFAFAASAATAVATAQSVQADRLRHSHEAAEAERRRWARELHDETLQGLGALRVLLSSALRNSEPGQPMTRAGHEAVAQIEQEIENLRAIIAELRPAALDELGLRPAIEALVERQRTVHGIEMECSLALPDRVKGAMRLPQALEDVAYRFVQEALTNVAKHSRAEHASVRLSHTNGQLEAAVIDDGGGFDPSQALRGFGLLGMRERIELAGGTLDIQSTPKGTSVRAVLPTAEPPSRLRR
jgi:signal transduction histidine kinase